MTRSNRSLPFCPGPCAMSRSRTCGEYGTDSDHIASRVCTFHKIVPSNEAHQGALGQDGPHFWDPLPTEVSQEVALEDLAESFGDAVSGSNEVLLARDQLVDQLP